MNSKTHFIKLFYLKKIIKLVFIKYFYKNLVYFLISVYSFILPLRIFLLPLSIDYCQIFIAPLKRLSIPRLKLNGAYFPILLNLFFQPSNQWIILIICCLMSLRLFCHGYLFLPTNFKLRPTALAKFYYSWFLVSGKILQQHSWYCFSRCFCFTTSVSKFLVEWPLPLIMSLLKKYFCLVIRKFP